MLSSKDLLHKSSRLLILVLTVEQIVFRHTVLRGSVEHFVEKVIAILQASEDIVRFPTDSFYVAEDLFETGDARSWVVFIWFMFRCHFGGKTRCYYLRIVVLRHNLFLSFPVRFADRFL